MTNNEILSFENKLWLDVLPSGLTGVAVLTPGSTRAGGILTKDVKKQKTGIG